MPQSSETDDQGRTKHHQQVVMLKNTPSQTIEERRMLSRTRGDREITDLRAASTISEIFCFPFSPFIAPPIPNIPQKIDEKLMFMS